ncbi:MAG TPA: hypothetical protein VGZ90_03800 [Puia sp.]|jgi:hypothetical protein|nr:hypothetical protein [Puia sp.]
MKYLPVVFLVICLFSCNQQQENERIVLQNQIDSLRSRLDSSYRPGLGEFMLSIQMHHAKIWFAGKNGNWGLADFEVGEIQETITDINKYCTDRPEISSLPMIDQPLDSLKIAITRKNIEAFKSSFILLTNTCNNCHKVTKHSFNVIKIPDTPPVSNQAFEIPNP